MKTCQNHFTMFPICCWKSHQYQIVKSIYAEETKNYFIGRLNTTLLKTVHIAATFTILDLKLCLYKLFEETFSITCFMLRG